MPQQTPEAVQAALAQPMDYKWRLKSVTNKAKKPYPEGTKGQFLAYIDARDVFNRLDDVLGLANWQSVVKQINDDGSAVVSLSIRVDGEWITREDVGYPNNPGAGIEEEPLKAAVSDAVKRAAIHFGIGRFLYEMKAVWVPINQYGDAIRPLNGAVAPAHEDVDPSTGEIQTKTTAAPQPRSNADRVLAPTRDEERARIAKSLAELAKRRGVNLVVLGKYAVETVGKPLEACDAKELGRLITALQNETDVPGMIDLLTNRPADQAAFLPEPVPALAGPDRFTR